MFEKVRGWVKEHRKGIIIGGSIGVGIGVCVYLVVKGKNVDVPINEIADSLVSKKLSLSKSANAVADVVAAPISDAANTIEMVDVVENGVVKSFPRADFIRKLHEGWHASPAKIAQALAMNIDLRPGETIVDACTVTKKIIANS